MAGIRVIRLLAVGAFDGVEPMWRSFINVLALNVFKVDVAVQVGDLGAADEAERAWRALADERLADAELSLSLHGGAEGWAPVTLPGPGPLVHAGAGARELKTTIDRERPALAICGGAVDTQPGKTWVGDTMCLDPGGAQSSGALSGWVVDLGPTGVMVARPFGA